MIDSQDLGSLKGAPILGPDAEKIGTVAQVFVDPDGGRPNWVTVHAGLFGRREYFIPVGDAQWDSEALRVNVNKRQVKDAPHIDVDGPLDPQQEAELYRYYGLASADAEERAASGVIAGEDGNAAGETRLDEYVMAENPSTEAPTALEDTPAEPASSTEAGAPAGAHADAPSGSEAPRERGRHRA